MSRLFHPDGPSKPRNGLLASRFWRQIKRYVHVEVYDRDGGHSHPRVRFEVVAPRLAMLALTAIKVPCVACGRPIHPVRARAENDDRRNPASRPSPHGHYYLAVTCSLRTNIGCSRSGAARDEYDEIKLALRPDLAAPTESRGPTTTGRPPTTRRPKPMKKTTKKTIKVGRQLHEVMSVKKPTARDKALAKIRATKLDLQAMKRVAKDAVAFATDKHRQARKATLAKLSAEAAVYKSRTKLDRAKQSLADIDRKLAEAKEAKFAREAAQAEARRREAAAQASENDEDEDEDEQEEQEAGATDADDMGDDDENETSSAEDDMGDDEEEETDEGNDLREDSV